MSLLEASHVVSGYGEVEILHGVSLRIEKGEIVSIIGPNGAGKSTLMKAIFGLLKIHGGDISLNGEEITGLPPQTIVQKGISYVPQSENVFPTLTLRENLEMGAFTRTDGQRERMDEVLQLFPDLTDRLGQSASKLSGGQRQMLALARALMLDPRLLLLDEPTASLSPKMVDGIFAAIHDINRSGVAILLVEQNARQALSLCHRGYVLAMGQNRLEGSGEDLLANDEVGRLYLGA
jgi:ABC-type branched-subunit amino acid transport system ATPase component